MDELKKHQPSLDIEGQISNLEEKGLIINDIDFAKRILNDISYFRLIKGYSLEFKPKNGKYNPNTTFEKILDLYFFDEEMRHELFIIIETIEVNARCRIANHISNKYGVHGYLDRSIFKNEEYYDKFMEDVDEEVKRNFRAPFVKNFQNNYEKRDLPIYALVEICSFGTLSKLYKNLNNSDKKEIAKAYGIGYTYVESWLESISYVRNICAHYGRIYNAKLTKKPMMYKQYSEMDVSNERIFAVLLCMKKLINDESKWHSFVDRVEALIIRHKSINTKSIGFIDNWLELLK